MPPLPILTWLARSLAPEGSDGAAPFVFFGIFAALSALSLLPRLIRGRKLDKLADRYGLRTDYDELPEGTPQAELQRDRPWELVDHVLSGLHDGDLLVCFDAVFSRGRSNVRQTWVLRRVKATTARPVLDPKWLYLEIGNWRAATRKGWLRQISPKDIEELWESLR